MPCYLPESIIINILHRLPAKSLLRCTAVCKPWYSLITSPQFISSHLNFTAATENLAPVVLIRSYDRNSERYDLYTDDDKSFTKIRTLEFPFKSLNSCFTIVGTCNGLLCLSDDRVYFVNTIILWNPYVKRSITLPKPRLVYNSYGSFRQCLGFGYDSNTGDYKVIRIAYVDCNGGYPQVELYRLSTGVWECMSSLELEYVIYNRSRQAFVNGAVHWVANCSVDSCDLIVSFDMRHEVFREMKLPDSLVKNNVSWSKDLVVFRGSLAILSWNLSIGACGFCVWVMNKYSMDECWMKHLRFDCRDYLGTGCLRPLWVRKQGGVVAVWQDGRVICCGLDDKARVEDLEVKVGSRSEEYSRLIHVDGYVESLVLLGRNSCLVDGRASSNSVSLGSMVIADD